MLRTRSSSSTFTSYHHLSRLLSTSVSTAPSSFFNLYRQHPTSTLLPTGTLLRGTLIQDTATTTTTTTTTTTPTILPIPTSTNQQQQQQPTDKSSLKQSEYPQVDFGLKNETPFHISELSSHDFHPVYSRSSEKRGRRRRLVMNGRVETLESSFNTAEFRLGAHNHALEAMPPSSSSIEGGSAKEVVGKGGGREVGDTEEGVGKEQGHAVILAGRPVGVNRGGVVVKLFDMIAFEPMFHVTKLSNRSSSLPTFYSILQAGPHGAIVSSYGGFFFTLAELVGREDSWRKSGGGSEKQRLMYLKLFVTLVRMKNRNARMRLEGYGHRIFPNRNMGDRFQFGSIQW